MLPLSGWFGTMLLPCMPDEQRLPPELIPKTIVVCWISKKLRCTSFILASKLRSFGILPNQFLFILMVTILASTPDSITLNVSLSLQSPDVFSDSRPSGLYFEVQPCRPFQFLKIRGCFQGINGPLPSLKKLFGMPHSTLGELLTLRRKSMHITP